MSAGIIFITGYCFISGKDRSHNWTGFGGKSKAGETSKQTAFRKVLDGIFGIRNKQAVDMFVEHFQDMEEVYSSEEYTLFALPIDALEVMASKINEAGISAKNFKPDEKAPLTVEGIIAKFKPRAKLLALKKMNIQEKLTNKWDPYFFQDLVYIYQ